MEKDEKIKSEKEGEERLHEEYIKKKKEIEDHLIIKTKTEISQEKIKKNKNIKETKVEYSYPKRKRPRASFIRIMQ